MEYIIKLFSLNAIQAFSIFWVLALTLSFNLAYFLFLKDRKGSAGGAEAHISTSHVYASIFIGALIVIGTYVPVLTSNTFALNDYLLLALVAAHGWIAVGMVSRFIKQVSSGDKPEAEA